MKEIPEVRFKKDTEQTLEFEITQLSKLFQNTFHDHDPMKSHRLNFYTIIFVTDGKPGTHYIDFNTYEYKQGNLIFIAKEQLHAFSSLQNNEGYLVLFTESFLTQSMAFEDNIFLQQLFNYQLYHPVVPLPHEQYREFETIITMARQERERTSDFASARILRSYLNLLLLKSQRLRNEHAHYPDSSYYQEFNQFQQLLRQDLFRSRKVSYYAEQLNMSSKKLNMITQEMVSMPVKTYITASFILEIKRILANSSLTVNEVGYEAGFKEPTNFVKFVKKYTDMTPTELRSTLR
ncbi:AraC family transcriptional activator of pobA [Catalinimonas alkaloidigena]|uniref:AraC family transcriptional regulator n=1 Tax=Catalinimonas alkaloidigena TaxID=1075417 RepID=UPI002406759D|nr:helix-turn-helix domain-containing protein [Catalinimonas alkaloidigena]MDF9797801.1 AraC family transcriptional activator of pobA [Catalinimonas alkaloidigena]